MKYESGRRYHFEFDGEVMEDNHEDATTRVKDLGEAGYNHYLYLKAKYETTLKLTLLGPPAWPPRPGDVWQEAPGRTFWFAVQNFHVGMKLVPASGWDNVILPTIDEWLNRFPAGRLVFRQVAQ